MFAFRSWENPVEKVKYCTYTVHRRLERRCYRVNIDFFFFFFEWAGFIRRTGHRDHYRAIALLGATDGYPLVSGAVTPLKRPLPMSAEAQFVTDGVRTCVLGFREPRFYQLSYEAEFYTYYTCLLYTSPSPRDPTSSRMPSSA